MTEYAIESPLATRVRQWTDKISLLFRQRTPVVEHVSVPIENLPLALRGLRIAHLSDFHAGNFLSRPQLRHVVNLTHSLHPDLIALTGDYVHRNPHDIQIATDALSQLHAPLGVHLVLGNHEHWKDIRVAMRYLEAAGMQPMCNEARRLVFHGQAFWIVGVDSARRRLADLERALLGVPPHAFKILLAHEPDFADCTGGKNIALQLSGHTHGGQIRLPWFRGLLLPSYGRKYTCGLERTPYGWVYVTRGIGVAIPPIRFNCPPEISLLSLDRSAERVGS